MSTPVYLDNNSTTAVDPVVFEAMRPYFTEICGNPSNQHHYAGSKAARAIEKARSQIAVAVGAEPESVVFTSGATESNNLAILGVCRARLSPPGHIVTSAIEHKAVIEPCRTLEAAGWKVTYLRPDSNGSVDWRSVEVAITPETALVSIMVLEDHGVLVIHAPVGNIPEGSREELYCELLEASYLSTSDAAFAIDAASKRIVVRALRRLSGLDYEELEDLIDTVGTVADDWDERFRDRR